MTVEQRLDHQKKRYKHLTALLILVAVAGICGCGDYAMKSDVEESDAAQQREIDALEAQIADGEGSDAAQQREIDALKAQIENLEAVFVSDVILATDKHEDEGHWEVFDGKVNTKSSWRLIGEDRGDVTIGYNIEFTNNTDRLVTVSVGRLVFEDSDGIQLAEWNFFGLEKFEIASGESRTRSDSFSLDTTVAIANQFTRMSIWASFE